MKKLLVLFMIGLLFSPVIAQTGHDHNGIQDSSLDDDREGLQSGFNQLYPEYRSGTLLVIAEILVVLAVTAIAVRYYVEKSGSSSLKEFIREKIL